MDIFNQVIEGKYSNALNTSIFFGVSLVVDKTIDNAEKKDIITAREKPIVSEKVGDAVGAVKESIDKKIEKKKP